MKKISSILLTFLSVISLSSCGNKNIEKVTLTYAYNFSEKSQSEIFETIKKDEYEKFSTLCEEKTSFLIYVYNEKGCECYRNLKENSLDYAFDNNIKIYEMDIKAIYDNNKYGIDTLGFTSSTKATYLSIVILENGYSKYQINYQKNEDIIEEKDKLEAYLSERIIPSSNFID